ncbi:MAG: 30S ribosomal protein S7 [Candidatus Mcinerneyibacterium aminivorans]|uniref:Small ribosomal subunit protein uS7 n=1 Tax=Candidatus Mcinerneyibacterium aminivorans TaxID=2703815 RepID=A0A5D0MH97_9BACT|nr:MAG: 30S ribosomal protein S7 [Candidatus Mcinerneyibacterium aminivorans]
MAKNRTYKEKYDNYEEMIVEKTINKIMLDGKKSLARNIFNAAVEHVQDATGEDGLTMFRKAVENLKPELEVKSKRIGGANYQVPIQVTPKRKNSLAIRWLVEYARNRNDEHDMERKLAKEIIEASKKEGGAYRRKEEIHKMAEANKAFAYFG